MGTKTVYCVTSITRFELHVLCNCHQVTVKRWLKKMESELLTKKGYTPNRHTITGEAARFVLSELGISPEELAAIRPKRKNIQYQLELEG